MASLSHNNLRQSLGSFLGQVLTPEIAAAIEIGSIDNEDRSHSPEKFGSKVNGDLVFRVERFRDIIDELHVLHEQHFAETERHRHGFGLNPNYDYMAEMERRGQMLQFTARTVDGGKLIGNIRMYVQDSLHTGTQYASEDTFYILPEYRKGWTALRFWRFMEESVRAIGVREIRTDSKVVNKVNKLNEYCGYKHVASKYIKVFTE
jgi:hypothetical protein